MIDSAYGGKYMLVTGSKGYMPNVPPNMCPAMGSLSTDSSGNMKIYDGNSWQSIGAGVMSVNLDSHAISILDWAQKKMEEEAYILGLSKEYPAIKDLLDKMTDTKSKIDIVVALVGKEVTI